MDNEEMIGIPGQLLDEHEDDIVMSEKVRKGIEEVYTVLVERTF